MVGGLTAGRGGAELGVIGVFGQQGIRHPVGIEGIACIPRIVFEVGDELGAQYNGPGLSCFAKASRTGLFGSSKCLKNL